MKDYTVEYGKSDVIVGVTHGGLIQMFFDPGPTAEDQVLITVDRASAQGLAKLLKQAVHEYDERRSS